MRDLFNIPESFTDLSDVDLAAWINGAIETAARIGTNPDEFTTGDDALTRDELMAVATEAVAALAEARAELAGRTPAVEPTDDDFAALAAQAAEHAVEDDDEEPEEPAEPEAEAAAAVEELEVEELEPAVVEEPETVVAAAPRTRALARPRRARVAAPVVEQPRVALTAAAENLGFGLGADLGATPQEMGEALARMMITRRKQFGTIPEGTHGDKVPIGRAEWSDLYPAERKLAGNEAENFERINAVVAAAVIQAAFEARRSEHGGSLVASGGLCAPVTPYYGLQLLATAGRPVRAALPAFNADRGGINSARPAALPAITSGVGYMTVAEDAAGGSAGTKTCQVIDCPDFDITEVATIYHCLQFGNLGARTFPELLAQWNALVMAAHARTAESALLDGINDASTQVTAGNLGLGATAALPSQIIVAAVATRSRNRMDPAAVLRVLLPNWVLDLFVSDQYRTQFQRYDMTREQFVALLRSNNVEPSFYIDTDSDSSQVFGTQSAGALLEFPTHVKWYIYPEGSFLFLDGGTLEIGLVRDSVLNATNDFQIFGETFENVAFIGVESLAVTSTVCDSGTVSLPHAVTCPITY